MKKQFSTFEINRQVSSNTKELLNLDDEVSLSPMKATQDGAGMDPLLDGPQT